MKEVIDALLVFQTVNLSLKAEEVLRGSGIRFQVLPLPKEIARGCSIAIGLTQGDLSTATDAVEQANIAVDHAYLKEEDAWHPLSPARSDVSPACEVYLDNNATTRPHPDVVRAVASLVSEDFGNPSSVHSAGRRARRHIAHAREAVAALIAADPAEIFFTSGGTEANSTALLGVAAARSGRGNHIITLNTEHSSVLKPCEYLEQAGMRVTYLPVEKNGLVVPSRLREAITTETILISVAYANSETGVLQPIRELAEIAAANRIPFHTDAVQMPGRLSLNVRDANVDLLSLSAHKFQGLKGTGCLYVRNDLEIHPLLRGGGQERGLRSGTENVPGIVGMGVAADIARNDLPAASPRLRRLRDDLWQGIKDVFPRAKLNGHPSKRLPNTLNVCFRSISGEEVAAFLDQEGICVSTGSACATGEPEPSHVLTAMGLTKKEARSSIRFSLGCDTTPHHIERTIAALEGIIRRYR
jgi:cysteine desulfurase